LNRNRPNSKSRGVIGRCIFCVALGVFAGLLIEFAVADSSLTAVKGEVTTSGNAVIPSQTQNRVLRLLNGYEWQLDEKAFRLLPDNCWEDLLLISTDKSFSKVIRSRASAALTLFPNDKTWLYLMSRIADDNPLIVKRRTAEQICKAFMANRTQAVEKLMIPLLRDDDSQLQGIAARCLQPGTSDESSAALAAYRLRVTGEVNE